MTPVAEKKEKKEPLVVSEIRLSMLEKVLEDPDKGAHTKHIAAVITDPDLCSAIQALIEPALVSVQEQKPGNSIRTANSATVTARRLSTPCRMPTKPKSRPARNQRARN